MSDLIADLIRGAWNMFWAVAISFFWVYAIIDDIQHDKAGWAVLDMAMPPLGLIRGMILYFN